MSPVSAKKVRLWNGDGGSNLLYAFASELLRVTSYGNAFVVVGNFNHVNPV